MEIGQEACWLTGLALLIILQYPLPAQCGTDHGCLFSCVLQSWAFSILPLEQVVGDLPEGPGLGA